ncbi:AraC family transcriptional regulator [Acidovorax sp.]|uniref:AraC family transcriptional regulator n=1 Tax=Acidovorax sp. TaxID=1872122 RepID=UPI0026063B65|nr:AraC family transcriptional regulator [Acidovorax sp.]
MPRTSSFAWVRGLADMFAAQGVDTSELLACAGMDPSRLEDPQQRFSVDEVSLLWEHAVRLSGNPALGLDRALAARHVNMDLTAYVMLSSTHLRAALENLARYMAVVSDAALFSLEPDAEAAGCWLVLGGLGNERPVPRQRYAYGLLTLLFICDWLTRRSIRPKAVDFRFVKPPNAARHHEVFGAPVRFAQAENRILLSAEDLLLPLPSCNPALMAMHEAVLRERLQALGRSSTSARVTAEILRQLHRCEPRREAVARSLAISDRTLQRRLTEEKTSFAELLDDVRQELARKYLSEENHSLSDVADLLGFADQSNFFRACRRWFEEPPTQYRQRVLAASGAPIAADTAAP